MTRFYVRRGISALSWYRSNAVSAEIAVSLASGQSGNDFWQCDDTLWNEEGATELDNVEVSEIAGSTNSLDGAYLQYSDKTWTDCKSGKPVADPLAHLRSLDAPEPPDDNITDGGELLRLKALRQAVMDEITWHVNQAAHHRDAAAECTDEDYTAEHWGHTLDAHCHDKAAERLRAILNAPAPAPEAAS